MKILASEPSSHPWHKERSMDLNYKAISPFLTSDLSNRSRLISYIGLGIGVFLLLCSLQTYINLNQLLKEKTSQKAGVDFLSVTKLITNDNMGQNNTFSDVDLQLLRKQPFIEAAAPLMSNQFRVKASAGNIIPFSTDLFLESVDESFIDTVPPSFTWKQGQTDVPIIFSSDFMEMYNVFAPSQDLPQLSEKTMSSVNIILECYTPLGVKNFRGRIVALSDRINSVLVPQDFLSWANKSFGGGANANASRVYIKTRDANSPALLDFIEKNGLRVNKDKTKFGRVKQILQGVVTGIGSFGFLVVILSLLLFSFYLRLIIAKSKDNLQLLLLLGFSPQWLGTTLTKRWIPVYAVIIFIALICVGIFQLVFQRLLVNSGDELSAWFHWSIPLLALLLFTLSLITNYKLIRKSLLQL